MLFKARPGRRWFQFSLRALMISTLIAASFCGGLVYQREVNQRLRAQVEQAKAEVDWANRKVLLERLAADRVKADALGVVLEARGELLKAQLKDNEAARMAAISQLNTLLDKLSKMTLEPVREIRLEPRTFWQKFQLNKDKPPDSAPIQLPKMNPDLQFDQPLIDRRIG